MGPRKRLKPKSLIKRPSETGVDATPPAKPAKRKTKRETDTNFNPKRPNQNNRRQRTKAPKPNVMHMRTNNVKEVVIKGEVKPYAYAAAVAINGFKFKDKNIREELLREPCTSPATPSQRQIDTLYLTKDGSPYGCKTVHGTKMFHPKKIWPVYFFENIYAETSPPDKGSIISFIKDDHPFYQSSSYEAIKQLHLPAKEQEVKVTPELLEESYQIRSNANFVRSQTQNQTMSKKRKNKDGSANDYAKAAEITTISGIKWEWLHLVAHEIVNAQGQVMDNLAGGTAYANTDMMLIESQIKLLAEKYPEGFTLKVKSNHIKKENENSDDHNGNVDNEHLQIATTIQYFIATEDFEVEFIFNAQSHRQPHIAFLKYIRSLFETLVTFCQRDKQDEAAKPLKARGLQFFDKDAAIAKSDEESLRRKIKL